jgi:hypothetical protein
MSDQLLQSAAARVTLKAHLALDHITPATGLTTLAVVISKNGGAFENPNVGATNATEISAGWYYVDLDATDTNTVGPLVVRGTHGTTDPAEVLARVVAPVVVDNAAIAAAVWAAATRTLTAFAFSVTVGTNTDKSGYELTPTERTAIADATLGRDLSAVVGAASRSLLNAVRFLRNRWVLAIGGTLTVYQEDDATPAWTATVTTTPGTDPVTTVDPA